MAKLHAELAFPLRRGSQIPAEAKQSMQTAVGEDCEIVYSDFCIIDHSISFVQQPNNISLELIRGGDHSFHQRLQHYRIALHERTTEGLLGGVLERLFRRVGHMRRTVVNNHAGAKDPVADQWAFLTCRHKSFLAGEQELLGDRASDDLLLELVPF